MTKPQHVGERIARWCGILGIRQVDLARGVGVSAPTVCDWFAGRTAPRQKHLESVVSFLGISMPRFWGEPERKAKAS